MDELRCTICEERKPFLYVVDALFDEQPQTIEVCDRCLLSLGEGGRLLNTDTHEPIKAEDLV